LFVSNSFSGGDLERDRAASAMPLGHKSVHFKEVTDINQVYGFTYACLYPFNYIISAKTCHKSKHDLPLDQVLKFVQTLHDQGSKRDPRPNTQRLWPNDH